MEEFKAGRELIREIVDGFESNKAGIIEKSYELALKAHEGQRRMSGDPYITHSLQVAKILKEMKMDAETISAGLLHDVIEDAEISSEDIKNKINEHVSFLVEGVSHVTAKVFKTRGQVFSESLKKMFLAMAKDIRVVLIKLADRLHNMRTISFLPEERQKVIAQETLNVYAPLAHRLGMAGIKSELEDMSFAVLNHSVYRDIAARVDEKKNERKRRVEEIIKTLKIEIDKAKIDAEISGRPKHLYSIYQKMSKESKKFEDIYDLTAFRIVTETISQCYTVVGIIHNLWKPVPGRFKDYIAMPKSNMYQSLHTTVLDNTGHPIEMQIRTYEMDEVAEKGIAAHWNYKEDRAFDRKTDSAFIWVRQLLEWQSGLRESGEFIKELKINFFEEEVFIFTPKGEVKELVKGSTILDFAYSVHSDLGDRCVGGKVNGKWVTMKYELKNGDIVEIVTGPHQHPVVDWLKIVKTTKAKNRIRHWLRTNQNVMENIEKGTILLEHKLDEYEIKPDDISGEMWAALLDFHNLKEKEDLIAGIGYGEFSENKVVNFLRKFLNDKKKVRKFPDVSKRITKGEIIIDGEYSDITYKLAKCCNPVPGDEITGIFTKKGISIHRKNCSNTVINNIVAPIVRVDWSDNIQNYYLIKLKVRSKNRHGLVNDLVSTVTKNDSYISSVSPHIQHENHLIVDLNVKVKGQSHMSDLINSLKKVRDVAGVERMAD